MKKSFKKLTVIVLCHPIESHPNTQIVQTTLKSLSYLKEVEIEAVIVSHDYPRIFASKTLKHNYMEYRKRIGRIGIEFEKKYQVRIMFARKFGHLVGNIRHALSQVSTDYILLVQQDMPFVRETNIHELLELMEREPQIKHVRFNKNQNIRRGWDAGSAERKNFYSETNTDPKLIQTLAWSDENHLTTKKYYEQVVLPIVGKLKTFPESVLNQLSNEETHSLFGTHIVGQLNEAPLINHLDGSLSNVQRIGIDAKLNRLRRRILWSLYYRVGKKNLRQMLRKEKEKCNE